MKIGKISIKNNLFLAPMAGYTDIAFREQCKKYGAGLTTTEMVSAKGLIYDSKKTEQLLYVSPLEDVKVVQLFGCEPKVMSEAIKHEVLKQFDIIDINMGCPAPKIVKNGEGSALMTNIPLASEIVKACVEATDRPITVKMRLGFAKNNAVEFAKAMERAGASAVTVHGRLKTQGYSGKADWEAIAEVKKSVSIPVIANGDICCKKDYEDCLKITNADAVMVGRASIGNPFIFSDILGIPCDRDSLRAIKEQYDLLLKFYDEHYVVTTMRKQISQYIKGMQVSTELKLELMKKETVSEVMEILKGIFK